MSQASSLSCSHWSRNTVSNVSTWTSRHPPSSTSHLVGSQHDRRHPIPFLCCVTPIQRNYSTSHIGTNMVFTHSAHALQDEPTPQGQFGQRREVTRMGDDARFESQYPPQPMRLHLGMLHWPWQPPHPLFSTQHHTQALQMSLARITAVLISFSSLLLSLFRCS